MMKGHGINAMSLEISVMIYRYENLYLIKYWIIEKGKILYIFILYCIFITLLKKKISFIDVFIHYKNLLLI